MRLEDLTSKLFYTDSHLAQLDTIPVFMNKEDGPAMDRKLALAGIGLLHLYDIELRVDRICDENGNINITEHDFIKYLWNPFKTFAQENYPDGTPSYYAGKEQLEKMWKMFPDEIRNMSIKEIVDLYLISNNVLDRFNLDVEASIHSQEKSYYGSQESNTEYYTGAIDICEASEIPSCLSRTYRDFPDLVDYMSLVEQLISENHMNPEDIIPKNVQYKDLDRAQQLASKYGLDIDFKTELADSMDLIKLGSEQESRYFKMLENQINNDYFVMDNEYLKYKLWNHFLNGCNTVPISYNHNQCDHKELDYYIKQAQKHDCANLSMFLTEIKLYDKSIQKYELDESPESSITINEKILHRIKALIDFEDVEKGDLGGYVESTKNLSQDGFCWIYGDAKVYESAYVGDRAAVCDNADIHGGSKILHNALVENNARISGSSKILHDAIIQDNAIIENSIICDNVQIIGYAQIKDSGIENQSEVKDGVQIEHSHIMAGYYSDNAYVFNSDINGITYNVNVSGNSKILVSNISGGEINICENSIIESSKLDGDIFMSGETKISNSEISGNIALSDSASIQTIQPINANIILDGNQIFENSLDNMLEEKRSIQNDVDFEMSKDIYNTEEIEQ